MQIERLPVNIGAEVSGIHLRDAVHDDTLFAELKAQLLKHRVLFFRDQDMDRFSRADHVALASRRDPIVAQVHGVGRAHRIAVRPFRADPARRPGLRPLIAHYGGGTPVHEERGRAARRWRRRKRNADSNA